MSEALGCVRVRVPATSANLGSGFDSCGLALGFYDELTVTWVPAEEGVRVTAVGEGTSGAGLVPTDGSNLIAQSVSAAFIACGLEQPGLRIEAVNRIPHGRGMGSSAAAIVGGVTAARGLLAGRVDLSPQRCFALAATIEGHPDNVAPALFGGFTVAWRQSSTADTLLQGGGLDGAAVEGSGAVETGAAVRNVGAVEGGGAVQNVGAVEGASASTAPGASNRYEEPQVAVFHIDRRVRPLVLVPSFAVSTSLARSLQPHTVPLGDAVFNVSRAALLTAALTAKPELLFTATEDRLHQSYRAPAMQASAQLINALRARGHAAMVSGAGPSVLVLAADDDERQQAAQLATAVQPEWVTHTLEIDAKGATVESVRL